MPKEPRKRARKHKPEAAPAYDDEEGAAPSWIAQSEPQPVEHPLDQELKAYFRSVDIKLQEWASEDAEHVQLIEDQREGLHIFCRSVQALGCSDYPFRSQSLLPRSCL